MAATEGGEDFFSLALALVAVQGAYREAEVGELLAQLFDAVFSATEDEAAFPP